MLLRRQHSLLINGYTNSLKCRLVRKKHRYPSACQGHITVLSQVAFGCCLSRRYSQLFANTVQRHQSYTTGSQSFKGSWRHCQVQRFSLFRNKVDCLGHVIRPGLPKVDSHATHRIRDLKIPTIKTKVR